MLHDVENLLSEFERGRIGRRELVGRLVAFAAGVAGMGAVGADALAEEPAIPHSTFRSRGLNHVALRVTDLARSRDFYRAHLGLGVLRDSPRNCFMSAGDNHFVALFLGERSEMDHYCYTIEGYGADRVFEKASEAGLEPRRAENRVYFDDPDGLTVQVAGEWNDYPGPRP